MTALTKRLLSGLFTVSTITGLFWTGGFDFNERGETLLLWLFLCVTLTPVALVFPFEDY